MPWSLWNRVVWTDANKKRLRGMSSRAQQAFAVACAKHAFHQHQQSFANRVNPDKQRTLAATLKLCEDHVRADKPASSELERSMEMIREIFPGEDDADFAVTSWYYVVGSVWGVLKSLVERDPRGVVMAADSAYRATAHDVLQRHLRTSNSHLVGDEIGDTEARSLECTSEARIQLELLRQVEEQFGGD
jgi:hypothetical protein